MGVSDQSALRRSPVRHAVALFEGRFGARPSVVASAPGRVNLIGEHTDYNGGPVLPVALQRRTAVAVGPAGAAGAAGVAGWEAVSETDALAAPFDPASPNSGGWTDYVAGVVRELGPLRAAPPPARLAVGSTVPVGAGLSSSAALTVSTAKALTLFAGRRVPPAAIAEIAYRAEHDQVGVRCGRMDQTISALARPGTALLFETATGAIEYVPMPGRIWIVETGVEHRLTGGELNQRRRECEEALAYLRERWPGLRHLAELPAGDLPVAERLLPPPLVPRVRHVVTETARVHAAARALARRDLATLGRLLVEGHESLRRDFLSTVPEADWIVESAVAHGAYGARLTGAGWGGAVLVLAPEPREERIVAEVGSDFRGRFGRLPRIWSTRAGGGVRRETIPPGGA
ncbi:MAG TPA: galactokinase family protein [Gemmatimonadales bacterium]|nr:galactokinase family protein [Gemmatimonadales bacterium]